MVGRSRWQEAEAIDHIVSTIMEQRGMNSAVHLLSTPYAVQGSSQGMLPPTVVGLPTSTNTTKITSHREF